MEFSWKIMACVVAFNSLYYVLGFLAQTLDYSLPPRHSTIPGTNQKFLYMQDLWRTGSADLIGVALIYNAFFHLVREGKFNVLHWLVFALLAIMSALIFLSICLNKTHKPDAGFPKPGVISVNGLLHLPYFGVGIAASLMCIWFMAIGDLCGPVLWMGLVGGVTYIFFFIWEMKTGNLDPLNKL